MVTGGETGSNGFSRPGDWFAISVRVSNFGELGWSWKRLRKRHVLPQCRFGARVSHGYEFHPRTPRSFCRAGSCIAGVAFAGFLTRIEGVKFLPGLEADSLAWRDADFGAGSWI